MGCCALDASSIPLPSITAKKKSSDTNKGREEGEEPVYVEGALKFLLFMYIYNIKFIQSNLEGTCPSETPSFLVGNSLFPDTTGAVHRPSTKNPYNEGEPVRAPVDVMFLS